MVGAFKSKKNHNVERKERLSESNDLSLDRDTSDALSVFFFSVSPPFPPSISVSCDLKEECGGRVLLSC